MTMFGRVDHHVSPAEVGLPVSEKQPNGRHRPDLLASRVMCYAFTKAIGDDDVGRNVVS